MLTSMSRSIYVRGFVLCPRVILLCELLDVALSMLHVHLQLSGSFDFAVLGIEMKNAIFDRSNEQVNILSRLIDCVSEQTSIKPNRF